MPWRPHEPRPTPLASMLGLAAVQPIALRYMGGRVCTERPGPYPTYRLLGRQLAAGGAGPSAGGRTAREAAGREQEPQQVRTVRHAAVAAGPSQHDDRLVAEWSWKRCVAVASGGGAADQRVGGSPLGSAAEQGRRLQGSATTTPMGGPLGDDCGPRDRELAPTKNLKDRSSLTRR